MKVWLDDLRLPPDETWVWVRRAVEAKMWIASGSVSEISLDNDLGKDQEEGYRVLEWLEEALHGRWGPKIKLKIPKIYIHTANPVAAKRMNQIRSRIAG